MNAIPVEDEEHEHDAGAFDKHRIRFAHRRIKIHGQSLATWAKKISEDDANRIATAINNGIAAGEDNTDIAHRVIGSLRNNGSEGATEVTRQHVLRLGRGFLRKRKSRMSGASPDVP